MTNVQYDLCSQLQLQGKPKIRVCALRSLLVERSTSLHTMLTFRQHPWVPLGIVEDLLHRGIELWL